MVFLSKLIIISCLLAFHAADANVIFSASHQRVNPLSTKNFILNCIYEGKTGHVVSVQLSKVTPQKTGPSVSKDLVTMNINSKIHTLSPSTDVKYAGGIQGKGKTYLSGKWKRIPTGFGGIYECKVNVMDSVGHVEKFKRQVEVKEENTSFAHSVAAIKELQTSFDKLEAWKKWMVLGFHFLDQTILKLSYSGVFKNKYYILYKHYPGRVRYAEAFCLTRGGYLAEINDWAEWNFVAKLVRSVDRKPVDLNYLYVSGRRNPDSNKFYWPRLGKSKRAYFNWFPRYPTAHTTRGCVVMVQHHWKMINWTCDYPKYTSFICEMPKI